jgi:ABC-type branched-subunit amino acid transport system substrate-binding protein
VVRIAVLAAVLAGCGPGPGGAPAPQDEPVAGAADPAKGRAIYRRGAVDAGRPIVALLGQPPVPVPAATLPCANCHGRDGLGRPEGGQEPSVITWRALTRAIVAGGAGNQARPAYDATLLRRAITMGLDPSGRALDPGMPRYQLTHQDLDDLIAYLEEMESDLDPGLTDSTIHLGVVLAPRSQSGALGTPIRQALEALFERINARGGIYGRRIELRFAEAPESRAERVGAARKLIEEERPFALICPYISQVEAPFEALASECSIPVVGPLTPLPAPEGTPTRPVFYLDGGLAGELRALVEYAGALPKTRLAVVLYREGSVAAAAVAAVRESCAQQGLGRPEEIAAPVAADWVGTIERLRSAGVSTVFAVGLGDETSTLIESAEAAGWRPDVFSPASLAGRRTIVRPPPFKGRVFLSLPTPKADDAEVDEYRDLVRRGHLDPSHQAIHRVALGAAKVLIEALSRSGRGLSRDRLIEALEGLREFRTGYTPPVTFGAGRRLGANAPTIAVLESPTGRLTPVTDARPSSKVRDREARGR